MLELGAGFRFYGSEPVCRHGRSDTVVHQRAPFATIESLCRVVASDERLHATLVMLQSLFSINPLILATSLALLVVALGLLVRRRMALRELRQQQLDSQSSSSLEGETSMLPLAHLASAVEVLDLDDLLAGEEGSVAAAARRQLEEETNVSAGPDTFFPLPPMPSTRPGGDSAPSTAPARASTPVPAAAAPGAVEPELARSATHPVPVRELALAWFEARGYRPSSASQAVRPIELVLRHRKDPARAYAFIVERDGVTAERVSVLVDHAHSIGLTRVLVASEKGIEPETRRRFRRQGVRLVDQDEMRREFDKLDLRVAAKIIAVARGRARLRQAQQVR